MRLKEFLHFDRCSIQRTQDQQLMGMSSRSSAATALLDDVEVPCPDVTPKCKALVGLCQTRTVWMSAKVGAIQRLARLQASSQSADASGNAQEVGLFWLLQMPSLLSATLSRH